MPIIKHPCKKAHPFQDKTYGRNVRVVNELGSTDSKAQYRCTVCGVDIQRS